MSFWVLSRHSPHDPHFSFLFSLWPPRKLHSTSPFALSPCELHFPFCSSFSPTWTVLFIAQAEVVHHKRKETTSAWAVHHKPLLQLNSRPSFLSLLSPSRSVFPLTSAAAALLGLHLPSRFVFPLTPAAASSPSPQLRLRLPSRSSCSFVSISPLARYSSPSLATTPDLLDGRCSVVLLAGPRLPRLSPSHSLRLVCNYFLIINFL